MSQQPNPDGLSKDEAAAQAVRRHHAQLAQDLNRCIESLLAAADRHLPEAERARQDLLAYVRRELVPHALAEEKTMYPAAATEPGGGPLVEGMIREHHAIVALIEELDDTTSPVRAAAAARALSALFAVHLDKENDLILPMLVAAPDRSLADLLAGMHALLGADAHHPEHAAVDDATGTEPAAAGHGGCGCGGCGCGGDQAADSA